MEDSIRNACVHFIEDHPRCNECSLMEVDKCERKDYLDAESARLIDPKLNRRIVDETRGTAPAEPTRR